MLERGAARLLTGPLAFLLAGVIDMGAFLFVSLLGAIRRRGNALRHRPRARRRGPV